MISPLIGLIGRFGIPSIWFTHGPVAAMTIGVSIRVPSERWTLAMFPPAVVTLDTEAVSKVAPNLWHSVANAAV